MARDTVGSFLILVEKDTTTLVPLDALPRWTWIHLSFTTSDNRVNISLKDNGSALVIEAQTSTHCFLFSRYYQYGTGRSHTHLHQEMADVLRHALQGCPRGMEAAEQYLRQFQQARHDFPAAMQAMMAQVDTIFPRSLARCENPADPDDPKAWRRVDERCGFRPITRGRVRSAPSAAHASG